MSWPPLLPTRSNSSLLSSTPAGTATKLPTGARRPAEAPANLAANSAAGWTTLDVMVRRLSLTTAISGLTIAATVTFVAASLLHFGVSIPIGGTTVKDSFQGAAIPEMFIAIGMAGGSLSVLTASGLAGRSRWRRCWSQSSVCSTASR